MMQTDPVCKMQVDTDKSQNKSDYQGKSYAFCSTSCKQKFDQNPSQYTQQMAGQGQGSKGQGGQGGQGGYGGGGQSGGGQGGQKNR